MFTLLRRNGNLYSTCKGVPPQMIFEIDHATAADLRRAASYPRVQFTAIINPNSGPGDGALPNESYTQAIQTLNSLGNVRTIGYVATTWCHKNLNLVLDEITVYAGWGISDHSLSLSGIFFDETPTRYTSEYVSYLQTMSRAVRRHHGLRDGFVGKSHFFISALGVSRFCNKARSRPDLDIGPSFTIWSAFLLQYFGFSTSEYRNRGTCSPAVVSGKADDALSLQPGRSARSAVF